MTTRDRILTLSDGGHEPHMIAVLLDLTVTDVALTLADPTHTPSDPPGGGAVPDSRINAEAEPSGVLIGLGEQNLIQPEWTTVSSAGSDISLTPGEGSGITLGGGKAYLIVAETSIVDPAKAGATAVVVEVYAGEDELPGRSHSWGGELTAHVVSFVPLAADAALRIFLTCLPGGEGKEEVGFSKVDILRVR